MGLFQAGKPKSAAKVMIDRSQRLGDVVLETMGHIARMVGTTLGPGGRQVLLERAEIGMKPIMTKDGVTVMKHLGYDSAVQQLILESVRDAATRTASEAGDGTTTATILADSICSYTAAAVRANPRVSPQKVVRAMQGLIPDVERILRSYTMQIDGSTGVERLLNVAILSANGDKELAQKIMEAFDVVGDEGNMTIIEMSGPTECKVERISGYTIERGYEESCKAFANGFINDKTGTMVGLERPLVVLYDGIITDASQIIESMNRIGDKFREHPHLKTGIALVAHGFSDSVLGDLHLNWNAPQSVVKVLPLLTPENAISNSRTEFLYDLQAYTGNPVFNPVDRPLVDMNIDALLSNNSTKYLEINRYRSSLMVKESEGVLVRVEELRSRRENPESEYDLNDLNVRIGKLTSGIARLTIVGPSQGETRERRDRAEDAWMSVRGAVKHGAIAGGGFGLIHLATDLLNLKHESNAFDVHNIAIDVLFDALIEPVKVLYSNYGYNAEEMGSMFHQLLNSKDKTFDIAEQKWVPTDALLDSLPAVLEAVRNSISIASLLGTMGGIIAFKRDGDSDKEEERFTRRFERATDAYSTEQT